MKNPIPSELQSPGFNHLRSILQNIEQFINCFRVCRGPLGCNYFHRLYQFWPKNNAPLMKSIPKDPWKLWWVAYSGIQETCMSNTAASWSVVSRFFKRYLFSNEEGLKNCEDHTLQNSFQFAVLIQDFHISASCMQIHSGIVRFKPLCVGVTRCHFVSP